MKATAVKSDGILLLTAVIWGFAFVAQRMGMDHVGPFTFNGIRFALGGLSLLPLIWWMDRQRPNSAKALPQASPKLFLLGGALAGSALFAGASLQQIGLVYTTAGNAGFITGLYVVIVPILGLLWKQRPGLGTWIGAAVATMGLYLLSITDAFTIEKGDLLVLIGAFFWASHVLIIGWLSPKNNALKLSCFQFLICSALSLTTAVICEEITVQGIRQALIPILYGGLMSVGIAYTLQVVAQKNAPPSHAAIILSLESPFAALGGWMLLNETLSGRGFVGCALMLTGMIISQLQSMLIEPKPKTGALREQPG